MKTLILSTPRSGSHYFSSLFNDAAHECVGRANKDIYLTLASDILESRTGYSAEAFYETLKDGNLTRVYSPRRANFFEDFLGNSECSTVHEHISLLHVDQLEALAKVAKEIFYLKRCRKNQIASWFLARETGVYWKKGQTLLVHGKDHKEEKLIFNHCRLDPQTVKNLMGIYDSADATALDLAKRFKVRVVRYEELDHKSEYESSGLQSFDRLNKEDQDLLISILG
jgi:hypothetical protein